MAVVVAVSCLFNVVESDEVDDEADTLVPLALDVVPTGFILDESIALSAVFVSSTTSTRPLFHLLIENV